MRRWFADPARVASEVRLMGRVPNPDRIEIQWTLPFVSCDETVWREVVEDQRLRTRTLASLGMSQTWRAEVIDALPSGYVSEGEVSHSERYIVTVMQGM